jgi:hypothetical protein
LKVGGGFQELHTVDDFEMLVLGNDDVKKVFIVEDCMEALEEAYVVQANDTAVVRPRTQSYRTRKRIGQLIERSSRISAAGSPRRWSALRLYRPRSGPRMRACRSRITPQPTSPEIAFSAERARP